MSNHRWRSFYVVFDLLQDVHLTSSYIVIDDNDNNITIFERVSNIMKAIFCSAGQHFNVKSTVLAHLFKLLISKSEYIKNESKTVHYLEILLQAGKSEWQSPLERTKQLSFVLKTLNTMMDQNQIVIGSANSIEEFDKFMKNNFTIYYKEKKDSFKVELLQTILRLLQTYNDQVLNKLFIIINNQVILST